MTKLQTAWLVFYYFLFVRIQEVIRQILSVFFVNFALFWRFATPERYYAEKWWCIFALFHEDDCKSNESQSEKALTVSLFFSCTSKTHYVTALTCTILCSPSLHFYLIWLSLWHSTTEKDITAIPSQTSIIICLVLMPEASRFTLTGWFWGLQ